jgi:hypothetical protein
MREARIAHAVPRNPSITTHRRFNTNLPPSRNLKKESDLDGRNLAVVSTINRARR